MEKTLNELGFRVSTEERSGGKEHVIVNEEGRRIASCLFEKRNNADYVHHSMTVNYFDWGNLSQDQRYFLKQWISDQCLLDWP